MPAKTKLHQRFQEWMQTLAKDERWCIVITADPDALGAAMALKRLLYRKGRDIVIASTNEITRPDNLAMLRYLRIPLVRWDASMMGEFQRFAIVDSQPHHNTAFADIPFSLIIDHHPLPDDYCHVADYVDIRPKIGATCTMLYQYLREFDIRPSKLLATAMLYGIRTDTAAFERSGTEADFRAYQWLSRHSDTALLRRILRSEYLPEWLPLFAHAFRSLRTCTKGAHAHVGTVSSPDMLVAIADFFTRVHGLRWVAVSGVYKDTLVIIFRGDGSVHIGDVAKKHFGHVGSAGGHRAMARAEIPMEALGDVSAADFVFKKLGPKCTKRTSAKALPSWQI